METLAQTKTRQPGYTLMGKWGVGPMVLKQTAR